jgi:hypothetical protein
LIANFDNTDPTALEILERKLHSLGDSSNAGDTQQNIPPPPISESTNETAGQGINNGQNSGSRPQISGGMSSSITSTKLKNRRASSSSISQTAQVPKYFELCVAAGENTVLLDEINISSVTNDGQLFSKIWDSYKGIERSALNKWFFKLDDVFVGKNPGKTLA